MKLHKFKIEIQYVDDELNVLRAYPYEIQLFARFRELNKDYRIYMFLKNKRLKKYETNL